MDSVDTKLTACKFKPFHLFQSHARVIGFLVSVERMLRRQASQMNCMSSLNESVALAPASRSVSVEIYKLEFTEWLEDLPNIGFCEVKVE